MALSPLAQSESKARFFERLGLDEKNEMHQGIYSEMKVQMSTFAQVTNSDARDMQEEAMEGQRRMTAVPDSLAQQFRHDPKVKPPYSSAQIKQEAIDQEIVHIYRHARMITKPYYDLARDTNRGEAENWVIRWMLWHTFRYRDKRNKKRNARSAIHARSNQSLRPRKAARTSSGIPSTTPPSRYWDPVRDI